MRFFQAVRQHQVFIGKHRNCGPLRDEFAFIEYQHPRAEVDGQLQIMRGDDFCPGKELQQRFELPPAPRIQVAGRFIQHQQLIRICFLRARKYWTLRG